ncbi:MAG TPA: hypothetical protein VFQ60_04435 [Patescibacteria group bacterium]|nr:hypothetical protein [Patescibacteria group bacterium]
MKHFLIFGNHPLLSLAEAKAVMNGAKPQIMNKMAVFDREDWDGKVLQETLAGTIKLGDVVAEFPVSNLSALTLAEIILNHPRGKKIEFGLTLFGASAAQTKQAKKLPIELKRVLQEQGRSVRWVTGERGEISPAAVAKADLIQTGFDFVIGFLNGSVLVGLTTHVQDADAWSKRDYGRPCRDEKTGMLPPKLARMMVNLALEPFRSSGRAPTGLLDPFCGGGTILMEAVLSGCPSVVGTDIDAQQIENSRKNMDWLAAERIFDARQRSAVRFFQTPVNKIDSILKDQIVQAIVTEGYLGKPLTGHETVQTLQDQKRSLEAMWVDALSACARIQKRGDLLVCVWPVFVSSHGVVAVDLMDRLTAAGYVKKNPLQGWMEKEATITYAREGQRVKRNLIVLERV